VLANNSPTVHIADLTTGNVIGTTAAFGGNIESLNANSAGTVLYLSQFTGTMEILGTIPVLPPTSPWLTNLYSHATQNSHDTSVGRNGNVFATGLQGMQTGVEQYDPTLTNFLGQFLPTTNNSCATFSGSGLKCWYNLSGMAWDAQGNLWVSSDRSGDNGIFEFDPTGNPLNFTPDPDPSNGKPIGIAVAPLTDPSNPGYIIIANNGNGSGSTGDVIKIDPHSCTLPSPGTCTATVFISETAFEGRPKYPVYYTSCPNPDNNGYVEICKQSNPEFPVSGIFDFTATVPFFSSGTIEVPVGECSGAVQVPSGQVTVTEAPTVGDLVSDVTACSYTPFGHCVPDLISWTPPDLYATVPVNAGGISEETLATFTNYAASPGQLKVCKIAGQGTPVGTEFTFTVTGLAPFQLEAGPADQGGFCELVGTFPVNTPVTIAETPNSPYVPTSITVSQGQLSACQPPSIYCTVATIGAGITEVSFTNTKQGKTVPCLACNR
jgi:hypothetical protein